MERASAKNCIDSVSNRLAVIFRLSKCDCFDRKSAATAGIKVDFPWQAIMAKRRKLFKRGRSSKSDECTGFDQYKSYIKM